MARGGQADRLVGVALVPGGDTGVAWSARGIRSFDGVRAFLPGAEPLAAVTAAADGTVFAIRGRMHFGVAARHAAAVWYDTPLTGSTQGLAVVGDHVAWFVATDRGPRLALTADRGRHWSVQSLPVVDHGRLLLRAGGVLELEGYVADCHSGDYSVRYRGRVGSNLWQQTGTGAETDYHGSSHFGTSDAESDTPFTGADAAVRAGPNRFWIEQAQLVGFRDGDDEQRVFDAHVPDGLLLVYCKDAHRRLLGVTKDADVLALVGDERLAVLACSALSRRWSLAGDRPPVPRGAWPSELHDSRMARPLGRGCGCDRADPEPVHRTIGRPVTCSPPMELLKNSVNQRLPERSAVMPNEAAPPVGMSNLVRQPSSLTWPM